MEKKEKRIVELKGTAEMRKLRRQPLLRSNGLMADTSRFPSSRDWDPASIDCAVLHCLVNSGHGKCGVVSRLGIGADGKCKGFVPLDDKKKK